MPSNPGRHDGVARLDAGRPAEVLQLQQALAGAHRNRLRARLPHHHGHRRVPVDQQLHLGGVGRQHHDAPDGAGRRDDRHVGLHAVARAAVDGDAPEVGGRARPDHFGGERRHLAAVAQVEQAPEALGLRRQRRARAAWTPAARGSAASAPGCRRARPSARRTPPTCGARRRRPPPSRAAPRRTRRRQTPAAPARPTAC